MSRRLLASFEGEISHVLDMIPSLHELNVEVVSMQVWRPGTIIKGPRGEYTLIREVQDMEPGEELAVRKLHRNERELDLSNVTPVWYYRDQWTAR